jgi:vitamin B12/bleomycin/antimicrobial peptide transport system ATP-binding/permease protein
MGTLMQISGAFAMVLSSFAMLAQSFDIFAQWKTVVFRLTQFEDELDQSRSPPQLTVLEKDQQYIQINHLTVNLPNGSNLINQLSMNFEPGVSYLIQDKSGTGKSVFLRTLAGIWPYAEGEIILPKNKSVYFLPQKPYFPNGSLKAFLCAGDNEFCSDEALEETFEQLHLQKHLSSLNEDKDWQHILSLGEQQKLFLAKILMRRPDIVFLDEATSALDEDAEMNFYQLLRSRLPQATIISVGHRASLLRFHQRVFSFATKSSHVICQDDLLSVESQ